MKNRAFYYPSQTFGCDDDPHSLFGRNRLGAVLWTLGPAWGLLVLPALKVFFREVLSRACRGRHAEKRERATAIKGARGEEAVVSGRPGNCHSRGSNSPPDEKRRRSGLLSPTSGGYSNCWFSVGGDCPAGVWFRAKSQRDSRGAGAVATAADRSTENVARRQFSLADPDLYFKLLAGRRGALFVAAQCPGEWPFRTGDRRALALALAPMLTKSPVEGIEFV